MRAFKINLSLLILIIPMLVHTETLYAITDGRQTSDHLPLSFNSEISSEELSEKDGLYTLRGQVKIRRTEDKEEQIVEADEVIYNSLTGEADLMGNIRYEDNYLIIKAEKAKVNLKKKTGLIYNAEIVFKKDYLRIITPEVQKLSDDHFVFKKATFTTCEGPVPDWCIKGRDVDFIRGDRLTAKDATFNIRGFPVLYTPYIWAPALTERKTGFLIPSFSYNNRLGAEFKIPFYILIRENADATVLLDIYTERGIGKAVEFRWRGLPGNYLDLWTYHIRDSRIDKDFYEFSLRQENDQPSLREFISLHGVTEGFFNTYNPLKEVRLTRFLSSSAEVGYRAQKNMRLFINAEYWQDLKYDGSSVSQRLPEAGISLYPSGTKNFYYWFEARAGNFYREEGIKGQRLLFLPGIMHSTGRRFILSQSLSLKGSYYWLDAEEFFTSAEDSGFVSELIYTPQVSTRLEKDYNSFQHFIEPSIRYLRKEKFIPDDSPLLEKITTEDFFDYRDIIERISRFEGEILNRFKFKKDSSELIIKLSQSYDTFTDKMLPFTGEASYRIKNFHTALKAEYNFNEESLKTLTVRTAIDLQRFRLSLAERFSEELDILFLSSNLTFDLTHNLSLSSTLWYDLKGGGLRNLLLGTSWKRQCWTLNLRYIKTPEDYSLLASIDLRGL